MISLALLLSEFCECEDLSLLELYTLTDCSEGLDIGETLETKVARFDP